MIYAGSIRNQATGKPCSQLSSVLELYLTMWPATRAMRTAARSPLPWLLQPPCGIIAASLRLPCVPRGMVQALFFAAPLCSIDIAPCKLRVSDLGPVMIAQGQIMLLQRAQIARAWPSLTFYAQLISSEQVWAVVAGPSSEHTKLHCGLQALRNGDVNSSLVYNAFI